jgi:hypothetical protein
MRGEYGRDFSVSFAAETSGLEDSLVYGHRVTALNVS